MSTIATGPDFSIAISIPSVVAPRHLRGEQALKFRAEKMPKFQRSTRRQPIPEGANVVTTWTSRRSADAFPSKREMEAERDVLVPSERFTRRSWNVDDHNDRRVDCAVLLRAPCRKQHALFSLWRQRCTALINA